MVMGMAGWCDGRVEGRKGRGEVVILKAKNERQTFQ